MGTICTNTKICQMLDLVYRFRRKGKIHVESMLFAQAGISVYMNVFNNKGMACFLVDSQSQPIIHLKSPEKATEIASLGINVVIITGILCTVSYAP